TAPVSGTQVSYTWQRSGTYGVLLTATDSLGKVATVTGTVTVADVPPALTLSPAAPVPAASPITLTGVITHAGSLDTERVTVDWGDGSTPDANVVNDPNSLAILGQSPALTAISGTLLGVSDTHTYAAPGVYTVSVRVTDQAGATSTATATERVGQQAITFAAPAAHTYGDAPFTLAATGGASGAPVTFSAGPSQVCTSSGTNGVTITVVGAGTCTVTASQAGAAGYQAATPVQQSFTVRQATLTVTAVDKAMTYGGAVPALTVTYSGFVNNDTATHSSGSNNPLYTTITGAPSCATTATSGGPSGGGSPVGSYPITCTRGTLGATNYTFAFQPGTLTITPAPQAITVTSTPPSPARVGATYTAAATGGASGNPVTFTAGPGTVCAASGTNGATITLVGAGTCTVTASQAGSANGNYSAATPVTQSFAVSYPPLYLTLSLTSSPAGPVTTGSTVTVTGMLSNHSTAAEKVTLKATFSYVSPSGQSYTVSGSRRAFTLAAGQTRGRPFSFTISKYVPRGAYTVALTATDTAGDTTSGSASLTVV
ncbi:MAG: PKD domain-containing protein, partial [Chloroflexota bacterium]|nr:PKD domain-containing protein [Chloroflexota bacterium]